MDYCFNHTSERAVGRCGMCDRPTCYRCSMTVDQKQFCSLECFNELNPQSTMEAPAMGRIHATPPPPPVAAPPAPALDEYSDLIASLQPAKPGPAPEPVPAV